MSTRKVNRWKVVLSALLLCSVLLNIVAVLDGQRQQRLIVANRYNTADLIEENNKLKMEVASYQDTVHNLSMEIETLKGSN